jgi:hypothetical protein
MIRIEMRTIDTIFVTLREVAGSIPKINGFCDFAQNDNTIVRFKNRYDFER